MASEPVSEFLSGQSRRLCRLEYGRVLDKDVMEMDLLLLPTDVTLISAVHDVMPIKTGAALELDIADSDLNLKSWGCVILGENHIELVSKED